MKQIDGKDYTLGLRRTINGLELFKASYETVAERIADLPLPAGCCDILVQNTAFVMKNGDDTTAQFEHFELPFFTIQKAIDAAGSQVNHCVVVYPGRYEESLVLPVNANIFFHPGVTVVGDITIADECYLHFSTGAVLEGNFNDGGGVVPNVVIGGNGTFNGRVFISGGSTNVYIHGHSWEGCIVSAGKLTSYVKNLAATGQVEGQTGCEIILHDMTALSNVSQGALYGEGEVSAYNCFIDSTDIAVAPTDGVWLLKDSEFQGVNADIQFAEGSLTAINCSFKGFGLDYSNGAAGSSHFYDCIIRPNNTSGSAPARLGATLTRKITFKNCHITTEDVTGAANVNVIELLNANVNLVLKGTTILVSKGTGDSLNAPVPVSVQVQSACEANTAVNANVTQTVSTLFVDALIE